MAEIRTTQSVEQAARILTQLNRMFAEYSDFYDNVRINVAVTHDGRQVVPHDEPLDLPAALMVVRRQGEIAAETGAALSVTITPVFRPITVSD